MERLIYQNDYIKAITAQKAQEMKNMIEGFKVGKKYRWVGPKKRPSGWNSTGEMDFILDGDPILCTETGTISGAPVVGFDNGQTWCLVGDEENFEEVN